MAASTRKRKSAESQKGRTVKVSCEIDVPTHARLCAAAALRGVTITTLIGDAIAVALKGVVAFDQRGKLTEPQDHPDPPTE
jgi:predicted HicB family RNase H-like nuclease